MFIASQCLLHTVAAGTFDLLTTLACPVAAVLQIGQVSTHLPPFGTHETAILRINALSIVTTEAAFFASGRTCERVVAVALRFVRSVIRTVIKVAVTPEFCIKINNKKKI